MVNSDRVSDVSSNDSILNLKEELSDALDLIESSGKFAAFETLDGFVDPKVFVSGIGQIQLPLNQQTAQSLIQACHQAPFGKGEQTITDLSVRNTWELNADQFQLQNPAWSKYLRQITRSALKDLGFDEEDMFGVRAELYKLLLYEKGAMFKPHKDSEKAPGMFGTLVICLPSPHAGGWVKLQHGKDSKIFRSDLQNPSYACWYSDVVHEVTELTDGYRCVLTFNLTADEHGARPSAKMSHDAHDDLRQVLKRWQADISSSEGSTPSQVIHLLEYEYTKQGLKLQSLKGRDLNVARALYEACSTTGFLCFLASCEKMVYGGCDDDYGGYGRRYDYDSECSDGYHKIVDICEAYLRLLRVVDMNGKLVAENVDIDEEDMLVEDVFEDKAPDDEDYSGFTGNEGVSATHWYRDTAIVVVPKARVADFLLPASASRRLTGGRWFDVHAPQSLEVGNLFNYFQGLLEAEPHDSNHSDSLRKVCQRVLSNQAVFPPEVIQRATEIATKLGDLDLLEVAMSSCGDRLPAIIVQTIGRHLSSVTLDEFKKVLSKPINSLKKLHKRHEIIQSLNTVLSEESADQPRQDVDAKMDWLASTMDELLATSGPLEPDDANALFKMLNAPRSPTNKLDQLEGVVKQNSVETLFMISFLAGLCQDGPGVRNGLSQEQATSMFKSHFVMFHANFNIPQSIVSRNETAKAAWPTFPPGSYPAFARQQTAEKPNLASHWKSVSDASAKLLRVYRHALGLGLHDEAEAMLTVIGQCADSYHVNYFKPLFLPFLRGLLPVWIETGIALSDPICRDLYQSVLASYSRRFVGEKPVCPDRDWARARVSCPCKDCQWLNSFIISPIERVGRFSMGTSRRAHIHQQLDKATGTYTHVTEHTGNPHTLVVTKTRGEWESKIREWETRRAEAKGVFESYGLDTLHELLGDHFQSITGLPNAGAGDGRPAKKRKIGATTGSGQHRPTLASNPQAQNVGVAATAGPAGPAGGAGVKRKFLEIIDLTEE